MKKYAAFLGATVLLLAIAFHSRADIIAGPITNPANGHVYYLLTPDSWTASEVEAENLGGTLAIVHSPAEQKWIYSTFGLNHGAPRNLWIGLHRTKPGGDFIWANGSSMDYTNWYEGEPNNKGGVETCVELWGEVPAPGTWNDNMDAALENGVAEISDPLPVTEEQRALAGDWYVSGKIDRLCHVGGTKETLYVINEANNAAAIVFDKKGLLFLVPWQIHGELVKDKIIWSNNSWWSRKPMDSQMGNASIDEMESVPVKTK